MINLLRSDILKLKRSLILLLIFGVPLMLFIVQTAVITSGNAPDQWRTVAMSGGAIWAYFLLPMTATAMTALIAQVEHGTRGWSYCLATPRAKWMTLLSKSALAVSLMAVVSVLIWCALLLGGTAGGLIAPSEALKGGIPFGFLAILLFKMWLAGFLVIAIQSIIALRFESFAVAVVAGISGTFVAVVATSAKMGVYFPWLLPTNILASAPDRAVQALITGFAGGLILMIAGSFWLARRDWN